MATVQSTLALQDRMSNTLRVVTKAMNSTLTAMRAVKGVKLGPEFTKAAGDIKLAERALEQMDNEMNSFSTKSQSSMSNFSSSVKKATSSAAEGFTVMKGVAVNAINQIVNAGQKMVSDFISFGDNIINIQSRLGNIASESMNVAQMQEQIFYAAQRSRGAYQDMANSVAKLGLLAKESFKDQSEIISFTELMQKTFKISGAATQERTSAMYQLSQAMAAGKLQGDEFRSIMENAPMLADAIAKYTGVSKGALKEMSSDGVITADIIKNSLFTAADEIESKFANMAVTFEDNSTRIKNSFSYAFSGAAIEFNQFASDIVNQGLQWIIENIDAVVTALIILSAIVVVVATIWLVSWMIANWPLMLIIMIVIMLASSMEELGLTVADVTEFIGGLFGWLYGIIYNIFAVLWNTIAAFVEFFANVWHDPLGSVARLFASIFDGILSIVQTVASAIDAVLGSNLAGAVSGFRGWFSAAVDAKFGEPKFKIKRMEEKSVVETTRQGRETGRDLGNKIQESINDIKDFGNMNAGGLNPNGVGGIPPAAITDGGGSGGKAVKTKEVNPQITEEDIKMLLDISNKAYKQSYKQLTPELSLALNPNITNSVNPEIANNNQILSRVNPEIFVEVNPNISLDYAQEVETSPAMTEYTNAPYATQSTNAVEVNTDINVTFSGDIRETADVDDIINRTAAVFADNIEEIMSNSLVNA